jgi:recombination protein RecT
MANEIVKQKNIASEMVSRMKNEWGKVLPKCCTAERFARVALSCINKNPELAIALQTANGKTSLLSAFMTCAEFGLEPNGRHAHLIPFKDNRNGGYQIQLIFDYKGIVELVRRSGQVKRIHASEVCENDLFEYNKGEIQRHEINFRKPRGEAYAYYAEVVFNDGSVQSEVMTREDVEKIRKRSKAGNSGPWVTDFSEMAKKTAFKRLSKWLPLSPEVKDAIDRDNDEFAEPPKRSRFEAAADDYIDTTAEARPVEQIAEPGADLLSDAAKKPEAEAKPEPEKNIA